MTHQFSTIKKKRSFIRVLSLIFCAVLTAGLLLPLSARAENEKKIVRVGWFESPFNVTDEFGRRSGYSYEYQRKIAAYTGWSFEYVEGTWSELIDKLRLGEIDLMSDVSYAEERAAEMLFPSLPMGTEVYYIYVSNSNTDILPEDYGSLNGKKVGVTRDSVQEKLFLAWEKEHGVKAELVELAFSEDHSLAIMQRGGIDAFLTLDSYGDPETTEPVFKIGSSDFYFAVNKSRPDLLEELNAAMSRIQDENIFYNEELHEKYLRTGGPDLYLDNEELDWVADHGAIRVGYQDNYLAFCASDEAGELTGALKDYLAFASTSLENAELQFEAVAYPTASAAMEALKNGEVDCMFPANLNDNDSESMGVLMSPPLMRTEMYAVVRASDRKEFIRKERARVAVNEGNPNYDMFLLDNYPGWDTVHYKDTPACLDAVAAGSADCIIISNYRFGNISRQCEKLHLTTVSTGVDLDYCFAVREGDVVLYSILSRVTGTVTESTVHAALTYYSTEDAKLGFWEFIKDNLGVFIAVIFAVILVIMILILHDIRAQKKVVEEENKLNDLNKQVFVDPLTSVRNRGAFNKYVDEVQKGIDAGGVNDVAIGVFDCDDLKKNNDLYGHDKGDLYLKATSHLICEVFRHSPVFRIGGDEFAVVLQNEDFYNRDLLVERFYKAQEETLSASGNKWEQVSVAVGVAVFDPDVDSELSDTVRRADKTMYENKKARKEEKARG